MLYIKTIKKLLLLLRVEIDANYYFILFKKE